MVSNTDKFTELVIRKNNYFKFPKNEKLNGDILILGNFNGICGPAKWNGKSGHIAVETDFFNIEKTFFDNLFVLLSTINNGGRIAIASSKETIEYFKHLLYCACYYTLPDSINADEGRKKIKDMINRQVKAINTDEIYERTFAAFNYKGARKYNAEKHLDIFVNNLLKLFNGVKFDTIIQNPPFNGRLHLDFLEKGIELLKKNGKMTIIEPSSWLIDVRPIGCRSRKRYDSIKEKISGHVSSVVIENFNNEFGINLHVPLSIVTIDMSKTFDEIDFLCCGEHKKVRSINDCNLIGNYALISSILEKVRNYGDMMCNHETTKKVSGDNWYIRCVDIGRGGVFSAGNTDIKTLIENDTYFLNGYNRFYFNVGYNTIETNLFDSPGKKFKRGGTHVESSEIATNVYGTYDEMKNWENFILNNKLSLFINIVVSTDQHNNSEPYLPWLVDKKYTDEELYKFFKLSENEKKLIDITLKKFKRESPWFKRLAGGPDYASYDDVNNFMRSLYEEC